MPNNNTNLCIACNYTIPWCTVCVYRYELGVTVCQVCQSGTYLYYDNAGSYNTTCRNCSSFMIGCALCSD